MSRVFMKRVAWRVAVAMLVVFLAAGPEIFGQNVQANPSRELSKDPVPIFDREKSEWGYADASGRQVIKPQFSCAMQFSEGLARVCAGGIHLDDPFTKAFVKMGYVDTKGHWVISSRFEYFFFDDFSEGLVPFRKQFDKWGYMDKTGKTVIHTRFDWAGSFSKGIAPVILDGKCAHIDRTGGVMDQSEKILERQRFATDSHGTYLSKPHPALCS
jgi:hypothetical protein